VASLKKATVRISMQNTVEIDRILKSEFGIRNYDLGSLGDLLNDFPPGLGGGFCTGTLMLSNVVLSAGHCISPLDIYQKGGIPPSVRHSNGAFERYLAPGEIAKLLKADFNYQLNYVSTIDPLTVTSASQSFSVPVDGLIDWSYTQTGSPRDHMVLRLKKTRDDLAGYAFGLRRIDYGYSPEGASLAVIQHPDGQPKKIAVGTLKRTEGRRLFYADIGTKGGSSGAAILNKWGKLVGLHTGGGCGNATLGNANRGLRISTVKPVLENLKRD
jgi:Trypsin-like peptidase domain